jgi:hypothetical protein
LERGRRVDRGVPSVLEERHDRLDDYLATMTDDGDEDR